MRLASFRHDGRLRVGVVEGDEVVDVAVAAPDLAADMASLLAGGADALAALAAAAPRAPRLALDAVRLEAPVPRPGKFLAVGLNYADHIAELGEARPDFPSCFAKVGCAVNAPFGEVQRPRVSDSLDYEGELGLVIGRRCRHVPRARAADVIAGYVVVDDFTVREWVARSPQIVLAKSFDGHGPFGPWIATPDEVGDPHALAIRTHVNGELRQDSSTSNLIFDCYDLVEIVTRGLTLEPGDVIATGTPAGVGEGFTPKRYLKPGDVVRVEVERIGAIENRIIDEPAGATAR